MILIKISFHPRYYLMTFRPRRHFEMFIFEFVHKTGRKRIYNIGTKITIMPYFFRCQQNRNDETFNRLRINFYFQLITWGPTEKPNKSRLTILDIYAIRSRKEYV